MKRLLLVFIIVLMVGGLLGKGAGEPGAFLDKNLNEYWQKGWEAYQAGEYQKAADIYLEGLQYNITNGQAMYNLACCYGIIGNERLAAKFLEYSIRNGFENYDHITTDPDFDKVRESVEYTTVVDSLQRYLEKKKNPAVKEMWFSSEAYSKTYVRLPDDYDPEKSYPLVIGLHGYGDTATNFIHIWQKFEAKDMILICPETFYSFSQGNDAGNSWFTWTDDEETNQQIEMKTEEYVEHVTRSLMDKYKTDGVYLLGFSQGCGLTYTTGIRYHDLYKGLICFGGWLNMYSLSDEDIVSAKEMKVFIAHGNEDNKVEFKEGKFAEEKLTEMGYDVKFHEFEGGHRVPEEALHEAQQWLGF
ncbi:MAG: alpha/beta hydrolase-fold protein [Candidatus Stygibacter frigidus]|nr:alpha/beta hydrolase-fold protein [Candidatus Stygibacter frigidus]